MSILYYKRLKSKIYLICCFIVFFVSPNLISQEIIVVDLGKYSYNIDDIRLGDYSITKKSTPSHADEELFILINQLLKLKDKQIASESINIGTIKKITKYFFNAFELVDERKGEIIWSKKEQLLLDQIVYDNYDNLATSTNDNEILALLELTKAQYFFTTNEIHKGFNTLDNIILNFPGTAYESRALCESAFRYFLFNNYSKSLEQSRRVLNEFSGNRAYKDALYFFARSSFMLKKYKDAVSKFEELISFYPDNKWNEGAKYFLAKSYFDLKNYESAISNFQSFIDEYPNSNNRVSAREMLAYSYGNFQDFENAIVHFEIYKKENPSILEQMAGDKNIVRYSNSIVNSGHFKSDSLKKDYYKSIIDTYPTSILNYVSENKGDKVVFTQANFLLAQFYLDIKNDPAKSLEYLDLIDTPEYSRDNLINDEYDDCDKGLVNKNTILYTRIQAYLKKGNIDKANDLIKKLEDKKDLFRVNMLKSSVLQSLYTTKKFDEALKLAREIYYDINMNESARAFSLYTIGNIYAIQGDDAEEDPIEVYEKLIREFPNDYISNHAKNVIESIR